MAENYKHLYECMKEMVQKYQDEIVPGLRELLENRVEVVRCKDCKHYVKALDDENIIGNVCDIDGFGWAENDFCSYGERKDNE